MSLLHAFVGVYKCARALRVATIPSNTVARISTRDVFFFGNRGESGATWRDKDEKDEKGEKEERPPQSGRRNPTTSPSPANAAPWSCLRKPIGNRATAKVCGVMPSRVHAQMLVNQLEKAESVVKDLFMEATDDGIEALEAVLAACCKEVLARGPEGSPGVVGAGAERTADRPERG